MKDFVSYELESISFYRQNFYLIKMVKCGEYLEAICEVKRVEAGQSGPLEVLEFTSVQFNELCTSGEIYLKPIGKVIFAFHECRCLVGVNLS
ncbi:hypothetical protein [Massilia sp. CCM 8734]|uniref:hypothetical protein n=1 Tax=Massilia sp. CCM 8734 TaxID=2609283 RepID=UPI00141F6BE5|nr:hypothetical protein [Massilia sp. CCM 8734]NHZ99021.1 hypothetical protein [Massilia sp. CCM 8734]